jgi:PAS domain S-box-containing protein
MKNAGIFFNSFVRDTELCIMGMLDIEGRFARCNRGMEKLLGANEAALVSVPLSRHFCVPAEGALEGAALAGWLQGQAHHTLECAGVAKSGETFSVRLFLSELRDSEGAQRGFGIIVENLTPKLRMESAIRQSEERFKKAFAAAPDGLVISRLEDGIVLETNESWHSIFGYSREETVGKSSQVMGLMDSGGREIVFARLLRQGRIRDLELRVRAKSGAIKNIVVSAEKMELDGKACLMTILRDVTDAKNMVLNLEKSELSNRSLLEAIPDSIFRFNRHGKCLAYKAGQGAHTGIWPGESAVGLGFPELFPREASALLRACHANTLESGQTQVCEFSTPSQMETREWEARMLPFGREDILLLVRDITGSHNLERLAANITAREQKRLGGELHDGICQELTGISFLTKSLESKLAAQSPEIHKSILEISRLLGDAILHTRALITGLYPAGLEHGLAEALRDMVNKLGKVYPCGFSFVGEDQNLGQDVAAHLYLIAQEAAGNAARHGHPDSVRIYLGGQGENMILQVSDDGRGISEVRKRSEGRGMDIMRYRARLIGARMEIQSQEGRGATVTCVLPSNLAHGFRIR